MLCILQLPPPVHGVSIMNEFVVKSQLLNDSLDIRTIDFKFGKSIKDLEKFTFRKFYKSIMYGFTIVRHLNNFKPDLIYFTIAPKGFAFYRDAYYILLLKLFRRKILIHLHGKGIDKITRNSRIKRILYKTVFKNLHVICLSEFLWNDIKEIYKGIPFIIPNGIKPESASDCKNDQPKDKVPKILYLSNFIKNKGVLVLVDALAILKKQGFVFKANLVGAPSDISNHVLETIIKEQNLTGCIHVIGPLNGEAKSQAYKEADMFVFPTYNDAFPLVTIEAMRAGLPVVSTFEGSIPDIVIHNETGLLVEKENPEMLAENIALLFTNVEMRNEMGARGYQRYLENFTLEQFERNMSETFQKVLAK